MKRLLSMVLAICLLGATTVFGQVTYQRITNLANVVRLTPPAVAGRVFVPSWVRVQAEGANVRWRSDGSSPSATTGNQICAGDVEIIIAENFNNVILAQESAGAVVNIQWGRGPVPRAVGKSSKPAYEQVIHPVTGDATDTFSTAMKRIHNLENQWDWTTRFGTPVSTMGDFACVWGTDGATYHQYAMVGDDIVYSSSADGETGWAAAAVVLQPGAGGNWDDETVGVPNVWEEGGDWFMLYRGYGGTAAELGIGFATAAAAGGPWTKIGAGVTQGRLIQNSTQTVVGGAEDPTGLIKVGTDYYLFTNSTDDHRITLGWLEDGAPGTWADGTFVLQSPEPLFTGWRFCPFVWVEGGTYYMLICRYYDRHEGGLIELWSSTHPSFHPRYRTFLGVVLYSEDHVLDVPTIPTTDITRATYTDAGGWCYFSVGPDWDLYLTQAVDVADYDVPGVGIVYVKPATYTFNDSSGQYAPVIDLDYGVRMVADGCTFQLAANQAQVMDYFVALSHGAVLQGATLDGNRVNNAANHTGACVTDGAMLDRVTIQEWDHRGVEFCSGGILRDCIIRRNDTQGAHLWSDNVLDNCTVQGNGNYGIHMEGDRNWLRKVTLMGNESYGIQVDGDYNRLDIRGENNNIACIYVTATGQYNRITGLVENQTGNSSYGFQLFGHYNVVDGLVVRNCTGTNSRQNYISGDYNRVINSTFEVGAAANNYTVYVHTASEHNEISNCRSNAAISMVEDAGLYTLTERTVGAVGASLSLKSISELVTIGVAAGNTPPVATSGNLAPANALILGVAFRVTDAPGGGAATIDIGRTGGGNLDEFIDGASCDVLTEVGNSFANNDGLVTPIFNASADTLTLTTDADVTGDEMKVRVVVFYYDITPPASNN